MQNYLQTVLSQYDNSPVLLSLIAATNGALDPAANITAFYDAVWNIDTATGHGLDIWGRIVGVSREFQIPNPIGDNNVFGFDTALPDNWQPFDQAPFSASGSSGSTTFTLSDPAYRVLILFKAFSNIAATTIPVMNSLLVSLFEGLGHVSPRCWVLDSGAMTMAYAFQFTLQPYELAIVTSPGLLPHPTGVGVSVIILVPGETFGFNEMGGMQTFDNGPFL